MIEELLLDSDGHIPPDYKFFVFHGQARLVQVDSDRFGNHCRNLLRPDWTPVDARLVYPPAESAPSRPDSLDEMIHIAEALGHDTDFVRVDLYDVNRRIVFGELTSYPGGAREAFIPESFDVELGRCWTKSHCATPSSTMSHETPLMVSGCRVRVGQGLDPAEGYPSIHPGNLSPAWPDTPT